MQASKYWEVERNIAQGTHRRELSDLIRLIPFLHYSLIFLGRQWQLGAGVNVCGDGDGCVDNGGGCCVGCDGSGVVGCNGCVGVGGIIIMVGEVVEAIVVVFMVRIYKIF